MERNQQLKNIDIHGHGHGHGYGTEMDTDMRGNVVGFLLGSVMRKRVEVLLIQVNSDRKDDSVELADHRVHLQ